MPVLNCYSGLPKKYQNVKDSYTNFSKTHILLPSRIAVIGSSGCGKSNILLNLILQINAFQKIYMFVKSPEEPLYAFFIDEIRKIEAMLDEEILFVSSSLEDLPVLDSLDPKVTHLLIFDDIITEALSKLKNVSDMWVRGRKRNVTSIFLSQSYFHIPKLIRSNTSVFIFKQLTKKDLSLVISDFTLNKTANELLEMYRKCDTSNISSFFMIDMTSGQEPEYIYRHNFEPIDRVESEDDDSEEEL